MVLRNSSNSPENRTSAEESVASEARVMFSDLKETNADPGYDEPECNWTPTGKSDQDCGEGLNCPPCG